MWQHYRSREYRSNHQERRAAQHLQPQHPHVAMASADERQRNGTAERGAQQRGDGHSSRGGCRHAQARHPDQVVTQPGCWT